ncbi:MAG: hypothetical protein KF696_15225 [Planctomycetes bacterium]|nr:hypothetical protein [Planctomycetota bacterium]MCW8136023.1 hypothetical protein [Planctomycetota bacterium]
MKAMIVVVVVMVVGATMAAQTYARTVHTGTYEERSGINLNSRWLEGSSVESAGPKVVLLPQPFQYFDRIYTQAIMMLDGRIVLSDAAFGLYLPYDLSTPDAGQNASIFVFGADFWQFLAEEPALMEAYFETDRVVFQWKSMGHEGAGGCSYSQFNFQAHLLNNGNIELHYGPERLPTGWSESFWFASGIVSPDGSDRYPGFGGVLTPQGTRPTPGDFVRFVPSGFTTPAQIELRHTSFVGFAPAVDIQPGSAGTLIYSFGLRASVASQTFDGLTLNFTSSVTGTATLIGSTGALATAPISASMSFTGFTHNLATASVDVFHVSVSVTAVTTSTTVITRTAGVSTSVAAVHGANHGVKCRVLVGPPGRVSCTYNSIESRVMQGTRVIEFELRAETAGTFTMTGVNLALSASGGLSLTDITEVRLRRVGATSVLLGTQPASAVVNFTGLNEATTTAGTDYAVDVLVDLSFAGYGTLSCTLDSIATNPAVVDLVHNMGIAREFDVVGVAASNCYVSLDPAGYLKTMPAQPGDLNLTGMSFKVQSNSATQIPITNLVFNTFSTSGVLNPRLYVDSGDKRGLLDAADFGGIGFSVSITATEVIFSSINGLFATQIGVPVLMVFDLDGPTPSNYSVQFELSQVANVAANPTFCVQHTSGTQILYGCMFTVGVGSAGAGIDLTIQPAGTTVTPLPGSSAVAWRVTCEARGSGGYLPQLGFEFLDSTGGVGSGSGARIALFLEGNGPIGVLDPSDVLSVTASLVPNGLAHGLALELGNFEQFCLTGQTRRFLVCVFHDGKVFGYTDVRLVHLYGGTNVRMAPGAEYSTTSVTVALQPAPPPSNPPRRTIDDDDLNCSTRSSGASLWWIVAGCLLVLVTRRFAHRASASWRSGRPD